MAFWPAARGNPTRDHPPAVDARYPRRLPPLSLLFIAGLNAVASAPICEQQIGQMRV
jgi:hypothetical protein